MMQTQETVTYIIKTDNEFYCGKTNNINRRLDEHRQEKEPHWFSFKNRNKKHWKIIFIKGDYEKYIKRAGVKFCYEIMMIRKNEMEDTLLR